MNALYQRLKELDTDSFERFCAHLLKEMYPNAGVTHIDGAGGDEGLDVYCGKLSGVPVIWQCKTFRNGFGKAQRQQVKKSLHRVLRRFRPKKWILCLSTNLDPKGAKWFERLQLTYRRKVEIELLPALGIVEELIHRRALRNHFFPGADLDLAELKRLALGAVALTDPDLESLAATKVEEYLDRLKDRDPRVYFEYVYKAEGGATPDSQSPRPLLSIRKGAKCINAFARDPIALAADPPTFQFTVKGSGIQKLRAVIETGVRQEFSSSEMSDFRSDWPLFPLVSDSPDYKLVVAPHPFLREKKLRTRAIFRSSSDIVEFGFVELVANRIGSRELELVNVNKSIPFDLTCVLRQGEASSLTFNNRFEGQPVRNVQKFLKALRLLEAGAEFALFDLEREKEIAGATYADLKLDAAFEDTEQFIAELREVEDAFGVTLIIPSKFTESDERNLELLLNFVRGAEIEEGEVTVTFTKRAGDSPVADMLQGAGSIRVEFPTLQPRPVLFGVPVTTGRCAITIEKFKLTNAEETLTGLSSATVGQAIKLRLRPESTVKYELVREESSAPSPTTDDANIESTAKLPA